MRRLSIVFVALVLAACGSSTDNVATRFNFAVVDGRNQSAVAGAPVLASRITSQLTKDPAGKFASNPFSFLLPTVAYAQGITLSGTPVADAIVCGRVAPIGEPQVVPLCAFTLADGKATNTVEPGTKAGTYNVLFTAQIPSELPVKDSTTVTVAAGAMASHSFPPGIGYSCWTVFDAEFVKDQFGNSVPYRFVTAGNFAHVADAVSGSVGARTLVADKQSATGESQSVTVEADGKVIATGKLTVPNLSQGCVWLAF